MDKNLNNTLRIVADYLDSTNPTVKLAYATGLAVADACDAEKLRVFDEGVSRLHEVCCEWVRDGFDRYFRVAQQAKIASALDWAEQQLRDYLVPRIGHQLQYETAADYPIALPYLRNGEFPDKRIFFWVAEAASQEGQSFVLPSDASIAGSSDLDVLAQLDEELMRSSYRAPGWLRRIRDYNGKREQSLIGSLSLGETRQEIGFVQWEFWNAIHDSLHSEKLKAYLNYEIAQPVTATTSEAKSVICPPRQHQKPKRVNTEYERIYAVMSELGALRSPCKLKTDEATLKQLCAGLDRRGFALPQRQRVWDIQHWSEDERNWAGAFNIVPANVKSFLANIPRRRCNRI